VLESFTVETFAPRLRETFRIHPDGAPPIEAELIEATALGDEPAGDGDRRAPFSIILRGPADRLLPQRTYRVEHQAIGVFDLFLVPIGPDQVGMRYEAVFG
jgi:hypothetical protein